MSEYRMREYDDANAANETDSTFGPGGARRWAIAGIVCGVGAFVFTLIGFLVIAGALFKVRDVT